MADHLLLPPSSLRSSPSPALTMATELALSLPPSPPLKSRLLHRLSCAPLPSYTAPSSSSSSCYAGSVISRSRNASPALGSSSVARVRRRVHLHLFVPKAAEQQGQVAEDESVDSKILPYCSIDRKDEKKSVGELEQDFIQALQAFYYEGKAIMSNEEFDNLKEELMWEGSSVVMLSSEEQKFLEASMAYVAGKPIMTDAEFDELKLALKRQGSDIVQGGPRCSLRTRKVYSDLSADYLKMLLLNVPATVVALTLFFFLDDITGFEITYLLELPEPFSFIFTWFAAVPLIVYISSVITGAIVKDSLILKGPCPNCGTENGSFFGTILSVPSGGTTNTLKCSSCATELQYDSRTRLITLAAES